MAEPNSSAELFGFGRTLVLGLWLLLGCDNTVILDRQTDKHTYINKVLNFVALK